MRRVSAVHGSKAGSMAKRQKVDASGVDFLLLCEGIVHRMEEATKGGKLIYPRQCNYLTTRLAGLVACIRKAVESCDPSHREAFTPLLLALYRNCSKAEVLVMQCGEEDWCAAAVFLHRNRSLFDCVFNCINTWRTMFIACARQLSHYVISMPYLGSYNGRLEDEEELRKRLEDLASGRSNSSFRIFGFFLPDQAALKQQHLARFLLKEQQRSFGKCREIFLWEKENEPVGTWGDVKFIGAGSGASGVLKTSWLGVPCAKKEFHGEVSEAIFMKEVEIMAEVRSHPNIVDFICYGNDVGSGDQFIAMELMEKSLFKLIEERNGVHFSLEVALDIIRQIAVGVGYLHRNSVAHRDLKPHNVVVKTLRSPNHEDYYCVKLVDFGTCKSGVEDSKSNTISYRGIGTTRYRAPEVHPSAHLEKLRKVEWFKADAYSFAMTCAHILTLKEPYEELKFLSTLYTETLKGRRPILPRECPKNLVDLVEQCWSTLGSKRPSFPMIYRVLENIRIQNMRQSITDFLISMDHSKNMNLGTYHIKEEQCHVKEEGHTSYFTAHDTSLYNEVVSQETDSKQDVVSGLEGAKTKVETV